MRRISKITNTSSLGSFKRFIIYHLKWPIEGFINLYTRLVLNCVLIDTYDAIYVFSSHGTDTPKA